ncbi:T9SS type A sorting domain-containing protein [candidate division WOR-3 bacterium]|uniref:T9SS type A sorting domain-containing protein n=1 Tax=candidate division WOR-3 bacterium TaxID=2052148 RepID=A0A938BT41_UNCW3|nr:T9SS type A sorting domain-containing protein [candidate division WOR-3 bacterium]
MVRATSLFIALLTTGLAHAQPYLLRAAVIDGGGTGLVSSEYVCGLSIGQQAASGVLTAGQYRAVLGFWHSPYGGGLPGIAEPEAGSRAVPLVFDLGQSFPNPFGRMTTISYSLARESDVELRVYNSVGRVVTTLVSGMQRPGRYAVSWDVRGVPAAKLPCGTYFCRLEAGEFTATRKMVKTD